MAEVWICRGQEAWRVEGLGDKKRWIETGTGIGVGPVFLAAVENAVAGAQHQLVSNFVGQADTRRKIVQVRRDQTRAASPHDGNVCRQKRRQLGVLPLGHHERIRGKVEIGLLLACRFDGREQLVAQTQVEG